jgi:hypothetical protein
VAIVEAQADPCGSRYYSSLPFSFDLCDYLKNMKNAYVLSLLFLISNVEFSSSQSIVFEKYFSLGSFPARIAQTPTGEYLITGVNDINEPIKYRLYLSKFTEKGELIWHLEYRDTTHLILPKDVKVAFDSTYYVLATYASTDYLNSKILLIHLDTAGTLLWEKTYSASLNFDAEAMDISKVGDITIAANCGADITHYQTMNALVMRVDFNGNLLWNNEYNIWSSGDFINDIKVSSGGDFVASCGTFGSGGGVLKGNFDGSLDFVKVYHAGIYWLPLSVISSKSKEIWLAGQVAYPSDWSWITWHAPAS